MSNDSSTTVSSWMPVIGGNSSLRMKPGNAISACTSRSWNSAYRASLPGTTQERGDRGHRLGLVGERHDLLADAADADRDPRRSSLVASVATSASC